MYILFISTSALSIYNVSFFSLLVIIQACKLKFFKIQYCKKLDLKINCIRTFHQNLYDVQFKSFNVAPLPTELRPGYGRPSATPTSSWVVGWLRAATINSRGLLTHRHMEAKVLIDAPI